MIPAMSIDLHSNHIALNELQNELRAEPLRLEEKKVELYSSYSGNSPLMSAAAFGNVVLCEFLLSLGANVEATNEV